jgi:putative SOS response-associated peptidase YedK
VWPAARRSRLTLPGDGWSLGTLDRMCGRFVSASPPEKIADYFGAEAPEAVLAPSYNVAPTKDVYVVLEHGGLRHLDAFHWGLVPAWAKDLKIGSRMINARAESLAEKPAFKAAFRKRRCIIPADGFYEWERVPDSKRKQPYYIHRPDGEPYAFAGLWELWRGPGRDQEPLRSCTIVTGAPNGVMARVHDRMPVILPESAWSAWLDRSNDDLEVLGKLLVPADPAVTLLQPVSTEVNNVRNDGPELVEPVAEEGDELFPGS